MKNFPMPGSIFLSSQLYAIAIEEYLSPGGVTWGRRKKLGMAMNMEMITSLVLTGYPITSLYYPACCSQYGSQALCGRSDNLQHSNELNNKGSIVNTNKCARHQGLNNN